MIKEAFFQGLFKRGFLRGWYVFIFRLLNEISQSLDNPSKSKWPFGLQKSGLDVMGCLEGLGGCLLGAIAGLAGTWSEAFGGIQHRKRDPCCGDWTCLGFFVMFLFKEKASTSTQQGVSGGFSGNDYQKAPVGCWGVQV